MASWQLGHSATAAGNPHHSDRVRECYRSGRCRLSSTSLARPGGNATGFTNYEYGMSGKWLELLKADRARHERERQCFVILPLASGLGQFAAIQAAAPSLGVELSPVDVRDAGEIERAIAAFAQSANGGLIVTGSTWAAVHRELIIALAARHRLPAIYQQSRLYASRRRPDVLRAGFSSTSSGARPATSIASSRARSQPTCRCSSRPSSSWSSTSRPPRRSASKFRRSLLARADEVIE